MMASTVRLTGVFSLKGFWLGLAIDHLGAIARNSLLDNRTPNRTPSAERRYGTMSVRSKNSALLSAGDEGFS
jgi:hypothetical protein